MHAVNMSCMFVHAVRGDRMIVHTSESCYVVSLPFCSLLQLC